LGPFVVGVLVSRYGDENTPGLQPAEPVDVLRFLMEQHDLKQSDLRKEIGTRKASSPRFFLAAAKSTLAKPRHWPSGLAFLR
jgi:antitoxin component HigA of HigAB toxin-antitoxin module